MNQLEIIAMVVKSENCESQFVQDLMIADLLVKAGLSILQMPEVQKLLEEME